MTLQGSGAISLADIATEFSDTQPNSMSEFYKGGSLVPSTETITAVQSGGNLTPVGSGSGGPAGGVGSSTSIAFAAGAVVSETINWSFNRTYLYTDGAGRNVFNTTLIFGDNTINAVNHFGNVNNPSNPAEAVYWSFSWYVASGSGIALSGTRIFNDDFSQWSTRGDSLPSRITASTVLFNMSQLATSSSDSGTVSVSGTAGGSGCTIGMILWYNINDTGWIAWSPTDIGDISSTASINANVPTSGVISFDDFYGAKDA